MSLTDRWSARWAGKLRTLRNRVNCGASALAAIVAAACGVTFHDVPRGGANDVTEYLGGPTRSSTAAERVDSAPERVWSATAGRGTLGAVAMGERVTAIASVDRWVYLLDSRSGRVLWRYRGNAPYGAGPVIGAGRVFVASEGRDGRLTAIDLHSGKRKWSANVGDVGSPLTLADSSLFGVTQSGEAFAYAAGSGKRRWMRVIGPSRSGALVTAARVAVVTLTDSLFVLDRFTGAIVTRASLGASTLAPLALVGDSAVALSSPGGEVVLASLTGVVLWRRATGAPVFGAPVVIADTVFAVTSHCTLWAIPVTVPSAADTASLGCNTLAAPAMVRDGVLVATVGGDVVFFDRARRRRVWSRSAQGELRQPPAILHGQIIVAPAIGDVVSFR